MCFRSATEKAGLELELDCPTLAEPVYVDRLMWEKVVLNLVSNAFKFTFDGKIAVSLKPNGRNVELRVSDSGVGIPPEELPRVFERFHRIENTRSRTHEGSGIGLALVQELVKLHGGSIRVESTVGKGTTFTVSLPLGKDHLPAERTGATRAEISNPGVQLHSSRRHCAGCPMVYKHRSTSSPIAVQFPPKEKVGAKSDRSSWWSTTTRICASTWCACSPSGTRFVRRRTERRRSLQFAKTRPTLFSPT